MEARVKSTLAVSCDVEYATSYTHHSLPVLKQRLHAYIRVTTRAPISMLLFSQAKLLYLHRTFARAIRSRASRLVKVVTAIDYEAHERSSFALAAGCRLDRSNGGAEARADGGGGVIVTAAR